MAWDSKQQPAQKQSQKKANHAMDEIRKYEWTDPSKMAEQKTVVDARVEGFHAGHKHGKSDGFRNGLSVGILSTALFFILVYSIGQVLK